MGLQGARGNPPFTVGGSSEIAWSVVGCWSVVGDCRPLVLEPACVRSGRDLRGRARAQARRGSRVDMEVPGSEMARALQESGAGIRGNYDSDAWPSDARGRRTEAVIL
jgi:hypothetical protein